MIDPSAEKLIPLTKAAHHINPARPPHVATVWRWASNGVSGIRLESIKIGGTRHTSREAVARFLVALNSGEPQAVPAPPNRRAERASRKLKAMGC